MASLSSARALLPAAHGVPAAALKAAATSGASFLVVCPAGDRAKAVLAALQAATRGAGLVLSSRVVARATKRSGGRTGEDPEEVDDVFFVGAGEEVADDDNNTKVENAFFLGAGEEDAHGDTNPKDVFFVGPREDGTGEEDTKGDAKPKAVFLEAGDSTREMTMEELVLTFHKETASLLRQAKGFDDQPVLASLMASCDAIGEQIRQVKLLDSTKGRPIVHKLIALHLRMVSCAGRAKIHKPGASRPEMWSGDRHRLPCKEKLAGTLMELLLYSMMLANAAMERFIVVDWDFTSYG